MAAAAIIRARLGEATALDAGQVRRAHPRRRLACAGRPATGAWHGGRHGASATPTTAAADGGDTRRQGEEAPWLWSRENPQRFVTAFTPLIVSVGAKVCHRFLRPAIDDEFSVGLLAVHEASLSYQPASPVPFTSFAAMVIRRRLIDHYRRTARPQEVPWSSLGRDDEDGAGWEPYEVRAAEERHARALESHERREAVAAFAALLARYGITLRDVVGQSPKHRDTRDRTLALVREVVRHPAWVTVLQADGKLPLRAMEPLLRAMGLSRRTVERRRRYIVALVLLLASDLPALTGYMPRGDRDGWHPAAQEDGGRGQDTAGETTPHPHPWPALPDRSAG